MLAKRIFLFFILFRIGNSASAQFLAEFSALQFQNTVQLSIGIAGGNTCNGITILRSNDGISFQPIGSIAGICGSSTEDVFYSFTDTDPIKNADNFYRLDLITLGYTSVIQIHFVYFADQKVLLFPNPVSSAASVYFQGSNSDVFDYSIYSNKGKLVKRESGLRGNYLKLMNEGWAPGVYFLELTSPSGKRFVQRFLVD